MRRYLHERILRNRFRIWIIAKLQNVFVMIKLKVVYIVLPMTVNLDLGASQHNNSFLHPEIHST